MHWQFLPDCRKRNWSEKLLFQLKELGTVKNDKYSAHVTWFCEWTMKVLTFVLKLRWVIKLSKVMVTVMADCLIVCCQVNTRLLSLSLSLILKSFSCLVRCKAVLHFYLSHVMPCVAFVRASFVQLMSQNFRSLHGSLCHCPEIGTNETKWLVQESLCIL